MEPVGSWYGYSRMGEEGGSQLLPLAPPGAFPPPPPPVYDLAPLFSQKAPHYGGIRKTSDDPQREQYHPQPPTTGFFDQTGNTAWSQGGQLPSPFGILPHESVVPDSPKTYDNFNHFAQSLSSFADPKKRTQSPPVKTPTPTAFFQQTFGDGDLSYGTVGIGAKTGFMNGGVSPQTSCGVSTAVATINKEYRIPQPPPRSQYNKPRNFTPQVATAATAKPVIGRDRRNEAESQSSPISFAMMDAQRGFKPRPQYPSVQQNFRFPTSEVRNESYNNGECARRAQTSASPVYPPMYSSPPQHDSCYNKPNPEPPPLDVTLPRTPVAGYSSVITRTAEKNFPENRFAQAQWGDTTRNDQNGIDRQQYYENNHHQNLQDLSSCRGDPMSLVKTLQQDTGGKTEDKSKKRRKSAEKPSNHHQDEYYPRVPPPAHHNQPGQNGYLEFERWNLPPPHPPGKVFPTSPVTFGSQSTTNFSSNHQTALMVPAPPLTYFPPFHLSQPTPPDTPNSNINNNIVVTKPPESRPKVIVPNIEEELEFLSDFGDVEIPVKPLATSANAGFMSSFMKFLQGEKEPSPPPVHQPRPRPPLISPQTAITPGEFPSDPQDDPRYFPLPKSSDSRVFDSSEDSDCSQDTDRSYRIKKPDQPVQVQTNALTTTPPPVEKIIVTASPRKPKSSQKSKLTSKSKKKKAHSQKAEPIESPSLPRRESSKRKAKEKPLPKEDGDEETIMELNDSDSDPAWIPQPMEEEEIEEKRRKKSKKTTPKKKQKNKTKYSEDEDDTPLLFRASNMRKNIKSIKNKKSPFKNHHKSPAKSYHQKNSKVLQLRKCPFKINSFIILGSDFYRCNPSLWRIKPKGVLQRYDPIIKDGVTLYVNFSQFSNWSFRDEAMTRAKEIQVKVLGHNKSEIIVQPLCYVIQEPLPSDMALEASLLRETNKYQDNFEVYIQTLFSQALDANFLMEIFHEKDDYFLNNVRAVDLVTESYTDRLWEAVSWTGEHGIGSALKKRPSLARSEGMGTGTCDGCRGCEATRKLTLSGEPYHSETLRPISESPLPIKDLNLCGVCCERAELGHKLLHQKCGLFSVCLEAVRAKREACPNEDTTAILNKLLADEPWTNKIFKEVRTTWAFVEKQIREAKASCL